MPFRWLPQHSIRRRLICSIFVLLACGLFQSQVRAQIGTRQGEVPRYEPQRPTTSAYLNLLRRDSGALPNYQALVRPIQRQTSINRQNADTLQRQRVNLLELGTEVTDRQRTSEIRTAEIRQTGTGSSFMNYSHYYPQRRGGR